MFLGEHGITTSDQKKGDVLHDILLMGMIKQYMYVPETVGFGGVIVFTYMPQH